MTFRALVSLRVSVTREVPLAELDYVLMTVGARLDTTGRFRFISDFVAMVDGTAYSLTKPLTDAVATPDATSILFSRPLSDAFGTADDETVSALKALADTTPMLDAPAFDTTKPLASDSVTAADLPSKLLSRPVASTFGLTDEETVAALKGLSETPVMQDSVDVLFLVLRRFDENITVPDVRATLFTPAGKFEQVAVSDEDTILYQKNIADGFAMNDGSEAVDGSTYSFHKGISNVAFVGDVRSLIFATSRVESVSVTDAGLLSVQDYCDLSYFAEDYVGFSQSF